MSETGNETANLTVQSAEKIVKGLAAMLKYIAERGDAREQRQNTNMQNKKLRMDLKSAKAAGKESKAADKTVGCIDPRELMRSGDELKTMMVKLNAGQLGLLEKQAAAAGLRYSALKAKGEAVNGRNVHVVYVKAEDYEKMRGLIDRHLPQRVRTARAERQSTNRGSGSAHTRAAVKAGLSTER